MQQTAEQEYAHIGETHGAEDHDHDLIHELSKRLDAVWRFDQYIANADGKPEIQDFWRQLKSQERKTVDRLKELIAEEVRAKCF
jgi:protoheme ferro-lyase